MHFINNIYQHVCKHSYQYLIAAIFLVLYYFSFLSTQLNTIIIDVSLSAENPGVLTFFWPTPKNEYKFKQSRSIQYPSGANSYQLEIPYFSKKKSLRLDPDSGQNNISLRSLSFTRSGNTITLTPEQIAASISVAIGLEQNLTPGDLKLSLEPTDPMLIFGELPIPTNWMFWIAPFVVLPFIIYLSSRVKNCSRKLLEPFASLLIISLAILYLEGSFYPQDTLLSALIINIIAALAILICIVILQRIWASKTRFGLIGTLLIIALFLFLLIGQMFLSLVPETITKIKINTEEAFNKNKDDGLNSALMSARDALENTFVRSFHSRKELLTLNAESKIFGLKFSPMPKVIIGKDNWFFEGYGRRRVENDIVSSFDNVTDYMGQNPFTESELEAWRIALEERFYWLKERGSKYIFALAPTKALVYPEKLPERILSMKQKLNRPTRYDQLINYLEENSIVPVVDLRSALLAAKSNDPERILFYRTDFHWNYYGALLAYRAIIDGINLAYPEYQLVAGSPQEFIVEKNTGWVHHKFMYMVGLDPARHKNDTYLTFFPKPESKYSDILDFAKNGIYDNSLPRIEAIRYGQEKFGVREIDNPNGSLPMMFIIGDSFIEKTLGYFSLHSKKTLNFRVVTNFPVAPFTQAEMKPDIVVQEVLNMYLLQNPPGNPPEVRAARIRAFEKNRKPHTKEQLVPM